MHVVASQTAKRTRERAEPSKIESMWSGLEQPNLLHFRQKMMEILIYLV